MSEKRESMDVAQKGRKIRASGTEGEFSCHRSYAEPSTSSTTHVRCTSLARARELAPWRAREEEG